MSLDVENNFFGRVETLKLLKKRVLDLKEGYRQNVALLGNRYVGKSAIIQKFVSDFDDPDCLVVYLDLENKDFTYFFHKFAGSLLYQFAKQKQLPLHESLPLLLESTKPFIPQTVEVVQKIQLDLSKGKVVDTFLGLLALPEIFTNETGKFCVLILDEFQNLEDFGIPHVFQVLGNKIMIQKKCFYIITSSYPWLAKKILSEKLSLLFGNFEMLQMEPFDLSLSLEFIGHNLKEIKMGGQLKNFLADFTGGYPLYLNLICQEVLKLAAIYKQNEVYLPLLAQAIENCLFQRWGVINRHFEITIKDLFMGREDRVVSSLLISLSNGNHKRNDLLEDIALNKSQVAPRLNKLLEEGIVVKNGNLYYFKDKMFKYWIKYVYQKRLKDVELVTDKQRKQFKDEFGRLVDNYKLSARQDFSSRVMELFSCFDNEDFLLNGRKYKLPVFSQVTPIKIRNENGHFFDVIKATTRQGVWFIVLKKDNLGESEVNAFLREIKNLSEKAQRCLLVSLNDLDDAIKLRALQERFWIWNEKDINTLLGFFDKPYISR